LGFPTGWSFTKYKDVCSHVHHRVAVAYFCHLFSLWSSRLNQSSGCVSFITTTGMEGNFIDLKWMKKVEEFWSHWFFVDILEESELFLVTGIPPVKLTT
jgi:hypothetical protein